MCTFWATRTFSARLCCLLALSIIVSTTPCSARDVVEQPDDIANARESLCVPTYAELQKACDASSLEAPALEVFAQNAEGLSAGDRSPGILQATTCPTAVPDEPAKTSFDDQVKWWFTGSIVVCATIGLTLMLMPDIVGLNGMQLCE